MNVAICDDNKEFCLQLQADLYKIAEASGQSLALEIHHSGEELCAALNFGQFFDVIFLDIEMGQLSGVDTGKQIRQNFNHFATEIIYITGNEAYAKDLFRLKPFDFLVKPVAFETLQEVFHGLIESLHSCKSLFEFTFDHSTYNIRCQDICYFYSENRKVFLVPTTSCQRLPHKLEFYGTLNQAELQIPPLDFVRIHKSFLINIKHLASQDVKPGGSHRNDGKRRLLNDQQTLQKRHR